MLTRALAVATGLVAVCFPVAGQQANPPEPTKDRAAAFEQSHAAGALDRAFALSLYQPKILSAKNSSLLFNKGRVLASENFGSDAKDLPGELMAPPSDLIYYGGEIGILYGHSIGKGSGDMLETYIQGAVGNEHLQITAGAAYEQSSGSGVKFRSSNPSR